MRWKLWLVIALTATMAVLVSLHAQWPTMYHAAPYHTGKQFDGLNGGFYWKWTWRRLAWPRLYPAMALAAVPFFAGQYVYSRTKRIGPALLLVAASTVALQFAAISAQPPFGTERLTFSVQNSVITSYYTAATFVKDMPLRDWLAVYDQFIEKLMIHARFKPPGPILFYWTLIQIFGTGKTTAMVAGCLLALAAASAAPATYGLVKHFSGDADSAFCAASFMGLCPSLILFLPQFDQVYPAVACVLLILWSLALKTGKWRYGIGAGIVLGIALFFSYIFFVFGLFMATLAMLHIAERGGRGMTRVVISSLIVAGSVIVLYLAAWRMLGFDPVSTADVIRKGQAADLVLLSRPFPYHVPFDFLDLALGTGWISFLLVLFYLARVRGALFTLFHQSPGARLTVLALLQIGVVIVAALLPGEGARLFLPLMPLLMAPIGLELGRWSPRGRIVVYVCLLVMTCVICQNMIFLYAGPVIEGVAR